MARYTETTNYDLRKPIPNSPETRNRWGTDLNRNYLVIDESYNNIQAQLNTLNSSSPFGYNYVLNTIPDILNDISILKSKISELNLRIQPFLDNPDCEGQALTYISQLESLENWVDNHITRLQNFNSDTYFETVTTDITTKYDNTKGYQLEYDNGLLKSFTIA